MLSARPPVTLYPRHVTGSFEPAFDATQQPTNRSPAMSKGNKVRKKEVKKPKQDKKKTAVKK